MSTNLDEMRNLLLAVQAQLDAEQKGTAAAAAAESGNQLPELVDRLADHVVHPELLRLVLLSLDSRLSALEELVDQADPLARPRLSDDASTATVWELVDKDQAAGTGAAVSTPDGGEQA